MGAGQLVLSIGCVSETLMEMLVAQVFSALAPCIMLTFLFHCIASVYCSFGGSTFEPSHFVLLENINHRFTCIF